MTSGGSVLFGVTIDYQLRYHSGLFARLAEEGWKVHIVSAGDSALSEYRAEGIETHAVSLSRAPSLLGDLQGLAKWVSVLREVKPSVAVIGTPKAGLVAGIAAWATRVPHRIYELHGLRLEGATGFKRGVLATAEWLTCLVSTEVVAVGPSLAAAAIKARVVRSSKIKVLGAGSPNGVDIEHFVHAKRDLVAQDALRDALGLRAERPTIAFIGRVTSDKGIGLLASALRVVKSPFHLLVVGGADGKSAGHLVKELEAVAGNVSFVGEVEDVAPYLAVSDVLCLPSVREGLPTVVLEALAAGIPVVATQATGTIDLIRDGETGWLVRQHDPSHLALALDAALVDDDATQRVTENGFALVGENFSRPDVQDNWISYLSHWQAAADRTTARSKRRGQSV